MGIKATKHFSYKAKPTATPQPVDVKEYFYPTGDATGSKVQISITIPGSVYTLMCRIAGEKVGFSTVASVANCLIQRGIRDLYHDYFPDENCLLYQLELMQRMFREEEEQSRTTDAVEKYTQLLSDWRTQGAVRKVRKMAIEIERMISKLPDSEHKAIVLKRFREAAAGTVNLDDGGVFHRRHDRTLKEEDVEDLGG